MVSVEFMDADAVLALVDKPQIAALASEVRQRRERVHDVLLALQWIERVSWEKQGMAVDLTPDALKRAP